MVNHKQSLELKTTHETVRIGTSIVVSLHRAWARVRRRL